MGAADCVSTTPSPCHKGVYVMGAADCMSTTPSPCQLFVQAKIIKEGR